MVTVADLKGLIRYAEQIKTCIAENRIRESEYLLSTLQENIKKYIKENEAIKLHDRVQVADIVTDFNLYKDFLNAKGCVTAIHEGWNYPYIVKFDDEELRMMASLLHDVSWKEKELEVI